MLKPILIAALLLTACFPAHAHMTLYVVDGLARVGLDDPPQTATSIHIRAARNEYEPFQVVVHAGASRIRGVNARITDFRSRDGGVIQSSNVRLYREHYVFVSKASSKGLGPGVYADALIPLTTPPGVRELPHPRFTGMPFVVEANKNQPLWIDVYVPRGTKPGVYDATLRVTAVDEPSKEVQVQLTVWNITLPDAPSMRTNFGKLGHDIALQHGVEMNSEEFLVPEWHYAVELAKCRISPIIPNTCYPRVAADGSIDTTRTHARLKKWIDTFHINGFELRLLGDDPAGRDRKRAITHLRAMYRYLKNNGWEKHAYMYVFDEPDTPAEYEKTRQRAKVVREANPNIKILCVEQPTPTDPKWGSLVGLVDIWVPMWPLFDDKANNERMRAGEEVWSYTAQAQGPGADTPFWLIDFPLLNFRVPTWLSWRYKITGLMYWSTVWWSVTKDVWTDPVTYRVEWKSTSSSRPDVFEFNGEGALFYPGPDAGIDGPVPSMRLLQIREGLEDYEYLKLLEARGDSQFVREMVNTVARSWTDWEKDPQKLYDARAAIAQRLVSK